MLKKYARKYKNRLVDRKNITEELWKIDESDIDYITSSGKVYSEYEKDKFLQKTPHKNQHNGYIYVAIHTENGERTRRLHRLIAKMFIPNPNNYEYVMHLDNNKSNYTLSNLKWGTASQNTQQAVDDGLLVNAKGADDSQSMPVDMYSIYTGKKVKSFGSISEASRETGYTKSTIINSANNQFDKIEKEYYFRWPNTVVKHPRAVGKYDYNTDQLLTTYINTSDAARKTGLNEKTISNQCFRGKPKYAHKRLNGCYFAFINYN